MSSARDALASIARPYQPRPGEVLLDLSKVRGAHDVAGAMAKAIRAAISPRALASGQINIAAIAAQAASALGPNASITPADIQIALGAEGMDFALPLGPGVPLKPYNNYGGRTRDFNYVPGQNIQATPRAGRIPFSTLTAIMEGYDIAQICLAAGTEIVAKRGLVPIEDIAVGDEVMTHLGRWRRVTETMVNPVGRHKVYEVRSGGLETLTATDDHPMRVVRYTHTQTKTRVMRGIDWVAVNELEAKGNGSNPRWHYDAATLPVMQHDEADDYLDIAAVLGDDFAVTDGMIHRTGVGSGKSIPVPARVRFGAEFGRVLGWYMAEGSTNGDRKVTFALSETEMHFAEQILADAEAVFGLRGTITPRPESHSLIVSLSSSIVARLFKCGTAINKQLPEWAWNGGREFLASVLEGWALGDGCVSKRHDWADRTMVATASRTLAWQMRMVAVSLGLKASVTTNRHPGRVAIKKDGSLIRSADVHYVVDWREKPQRTGRWSFEDDGRMIATAIQDVTEIAYDGPVYNFEVEEDHSYVTTAGTVHNCATHIISDIKSMPLLLRAIKGHDEDVSKEIAYATEFFKSPDGKHSFGTWITKYLYDQVAYDCATIYKQKDKAGRLKALKLVDGRTIMPVIDYSGDRPDAPAPAFVQFIEGIPWGWHDETQIIYEPFTPRTGSPLYGLTPIECVLLNANTDVRFQWHFLQFFTQGVIPEGFMEAPPDQSSADQLADWQELWNDWVFGDQGERYGMRWVPNGSKFTPYKADKFDENFPEYMIRRTCSAFMVLPNDLGLTADVNKANGETQVDVQFRISTEPRSNSIEDILNPIIQKDLELPLECYFDTGRDKEDRLAVAQENQIWIDAGVISPDEPREKILGLSVNPDERVPRFINSTRLGPIPLSYVAAISGGKEGYDSETGAPLLDNVKPVAFIVPGAMAPDPAASTQDQQHVATAIADAAKPTGATALPDDHQPEPMPALIPGQPPTKPGEPSKGDTHDDQTGGTQTSTQDVGNTHGQIAKSAVIPKTEANYRVAEFDHQNCGECAFMLSDGSCVQVIGKVTDDMVCDLFAYGHLDDIDPSIAQFAPALDETSTAGQLAAMTKSVTDTVGVKAAGLAVVALDTGRVLMLQRAMTEGDPAAGCWELPGGCLEPGEQAGQAAVREWTEETGCQLPQCEFTDNWVSPNGIYAGFVCVIPHEADIDLANRDHTVDPDGDYFESLAWMDPRDLPSLPSLRPEARTSDWVALSNPSVVWLKEATAGITSATGLVGEGFIGADGLNPDDDPILDDDVPFDGAQMKKALAQWRRHGKNALRTGQPIRRFTDPEIPTALAERIYSRLAKASNAAEVDEAFAKAISFDDAFDGTEVTWTAPNGNVISGTIQLYRDGVYGIDPGDGGGVAYLLSGDELNLVKAAAFAKASQPDPKAPRSLRLRDEIASHYAPLIAKAMRTATSGLPSAVRQARQSIQADKTELAKSSADDAQAAVSENVSINPQGVQGVFESMYGDAYLAGAHLGVQAIGAGANPAPWIQPTLDREGIDWDTWKPGWGEAAAKDAKGGLKTILDARAITIKGITDSAMTRLGNTLAAGLAAGDSNDAIARAMSDIIADPARALLVADTESARAMDSASRDTYRENGIEQVELLLADGADEECSSIADDNPHTLDIADDNPVPIHPGCRCDWSPIVDTGEGDQ